MNREESNNQSEKPSSAENQAEPAPVISLNVYRSARILKLLEREGRRQAQEEEKLIEAIALVRRNSFRIVDEDTSVE